MTTREQAIDAAYRWINGELPQEAARPVQCHEFDLGWVLWPAPAPVQVDPLTGARRAPEEIGAACAVVDRTTGELSVWPSVPVAEVIRLYRDKLGAGLHEPTLPPVTGPGVRAELTWRDEHGESQTLVMHSVAGASHPALRAWRQLERQGVEAEDVLSVHTDLSLAMLPGGYVAQALAEQLPSTRFSHELRYGPYFDHRAEAVRELAARIPAAGPDGRPAAPRPNRMPFPAAVPPVLPEAAQALAAGLVERFGSEGVQRFEAGEVLAAGLPDSAAVPLIDIGLPSVVEGFFTLHRPVAEGVLDGSRAQTALPEAGGYLAGLGRGLRATEDAWRNLSGQRVVGTDGWALITVDPARGRVRAIDPDTASARHCNADLTAFVRSLTLLTDHLPRLSGLPPYAAGPLVAELQWGLAALDRTVFTDPENWWAVVVEQLWHGLL
ncbi:SUKH-4 family immunity protein [Kitasatospora sp. HPMI-4]|uniref:SUKH-4 family immunity protein n=1 Tax=Kitasatospora sp. HPMI-4 TaxID=3448443 RepID=UPI003F19D2DF